jgi:elongation factor G
VPGTPSVPIGRVRNLGIVAHIDAGKTTVSERILFYSGVENRMGEVHEGTATMDYLAEERERGITIVAAATTVPWADHTIHLIDTPGHVDFTVEVERSMRVLDGAVLVLNAVSGVQAQSETVWRQMQRHHVRALAFVNQLDRPGADFFACVADVEKRLGVRAVPLQYPLVKGREERVIIDLLTLERLEYRVEDEGREPLRGPVPAEVADEVAVLRAELLEVLAEQDEDLLADVLEEREPPVERVRAAIRRRVLKGDLVPVLGGAALRNIGVQPLLDAVVAYLPAPDEVPAVIGTHATTGAPVERRPDPAGPPCALAFKLVSDPSEDLLFVRVYSGTIVPGAKLFNPRVKRMERVARVLSMHADRRNAVPEAFPGDIVALTGCKLTVTGDTLCDHDEPLLLERPVFPDPVMTRVVEPVSGGDRDRLGAALQRLAFEDPTFTVKEDEETGQWLIAGMGELHLEVKAHRLEQEFRVKARVGQPRVAYREALAAPARGAGRIDRHVGGTHLFGAVELELVPTGAESDVGTGARIEWADDVPVPVEYRKAVEEALELEARGGPRFGYPLDAIGIRVVGGEHRPDLASESGTVQAACQALRGALADGRVDLLEPVMEFEIAAPADFVSGIIGDLNARKAEIRDLAAEGETRRIVGTVPLFQVFGYATVIRSLSQGRATFSLAPAGFRPVPEEELRARGLSWS